MTDPIHPARPDIPTLVAQLRAAAAQATPGRWHIHGGHNDYAFYSEQADGSVVPVLNLDVYGIKPERAAQANADAAFIALANPTALTALCDAWEAAEREREETERERDHLATECNRLQDHVNACDVWLRESRDEREAARAGVAALEERVKGEHAFALVAEAKYTTSLTRAEQAEAEVARLREVLSSVRECSSLDAHYHSLIDAALSAKEAAAG